MGKLTDLLKKRVVRYGKNLEEVDKVDVDVIVEYTLHTDSGTATLYSSPLRCAVLHIIMHLYNDGVADVCNLVNVNKNRIETIAYKTSQTLLHDLVFDRENMIRRVKEKGQYVP